jgi:transposase
MPFMNAATLLSLPPELAITAIEPIDEILTIHLRSARHSACCPVCGQPATRMHSSHQRTVADLPCGAKGVRLLLQVHKFFCTNANCPRKIFVERIAPFIAPWARKTERLNRSLQDIGLATCGKLGARLAHRLGMPASWMTILRRILAIPTLCDNPVVHLGVDDFAFRRGRRYGAILVNLDAHRICDLLPDRKTETVALWMVGHPEIDLVSRDRGEAFAAAARQGAPQASQVTDRFHLLKNLVEAIEPLITRLWKDLSQSTDLPAPVFPQKRDWHPDFSQQKASQHDHNTLRQQRFEQVQALNRRGISQAEIAQRLAIGKRTVRRWLAQGHAPYSQPRRKHASSFDVHAAFVLRRWKAGERDVTRLWHDLQQRGYRGSIRTLYGYLRPLRKGMQDLPTPAVLEGATAREVLWLIVRRETDLDEQERNTLAEVRRRSTALDMVYGLVQRFGAILRQRLSDQLESWKVAVIASDLAELKRFVKGLERDAQAVLAACSQGYSNGMVEGFVNKVKMVKRVMFGKAGFPLLRQRVLHAF